MRGVSARATSARGRLNEARAQREPFKGLTVEGIDEIMSELSAELKARGAGAALDAHDVIRHEPRELSER